MAPRRSALALAKVILSSRQTRHLVILHLMSKVEQIEVQVSELSAQELARFRAWYSKFDSEAWDQQIELDASSGNLDQFAEKALKEHTAGSTRAL